MKLLLPAIALLALTGCSAKDYYQEQPNRDQAEVDRVYAIGDGLEKVVAAWRQEQASRADQRAGEVPPGKEQTQQPPCTDCGGPFVDQIPPTEAVVHLSLDDEGTISPTAIMFKDAASAPTCPQDDPCLEGFEWSYGGHDGEAPVQGTGQAITIYNQPPVLQPEKSVNQRGHHAHAMGKAHQQTSESLLLRYIFAEKQAAAYLAAQQERTKQQAEETKQFEKMMNTYQAAVLKEQPKQDAPYNPETNINTGLGNIPFISTVLGMYGLGKEGIEGARGNTTANMSNGSSLAQEGAGATGANPVTIIKKTTTTTHAAE